MVRFHGSILRETGKIFTRQVPTICIGLHLKTVNIPTWRKTWIIFSHIFLFQADILEQTCQVKLSIIWRELGKPFRILVVPNENHLDIYYKHILWIFVLMLYSPGVSWVADFWCFGSRYNGDGGQHFRNFFENGSSLWWPWTSWSWILKEVTETITGEGEWIRGKSCEVGNVCQGKNIG